MRALGVGKARALPELARAFEQAAALRVQAGLDHSGTALTGPETKPGEVAVAVVVPRDVRIDARCSRNRHGIAPRPGGMLGVEQQVPAAEIAHVGGHKPGPPLMMAQRGTEDTAGPAPVSGRELASAGQDVSDLSHWTRFRLWKMGAPGKYSKLDVAR